MPIQSTSVKATPGRGRHRATQHITAKRFDPIHLSLDVSSAGRVWSQFSVTQPVVANLTILIRVGDGAALQGCHRCERLAEAGPEGAQHRFIQPHAAHIQPEAQILVMPEQAAEPLPLAGGIGACGLGERSHGRWCWQPGDAIRGSIRGKPFRTKMRSPRGDCVDWHTEVDNIPGRTGEVP